MRFVPTPLRIFLGIALFLLASAAVILIAIPLLPWRVARIRLCNLYGKIVGRSIVALAAVTPNISHRERIGAAMPAIYVANHCATLDMFVSIWLCPFGGCGVLKKEMVRVPIFGQMAWLSGHLLLDRGNRDKAVEALKETAALVKQKKLGIWIMPEGTRSRSGRLMPFKKGFVHLAIATGLPVVPLIFHGANKNWAPGAWSFTPMTLDIDVLEPIDTSAWKEETAGVHADAVHDLIASRLREDQKPLAEAKAA
jgi:1-acyl-sn-glycerol-3-phosphate acyltransferase